MGEFEDYLFVIIQAPHAAFIDGEWNAAFAENALYLFKIFAGGSAEISGDFRQRLDDGLVFRVLAVEHAQRIGFRATLAVAAHLVFHASESLAKRLVVVRAIFRAANRIQLQPPLLYADLIQQIS